jgi:hypothetical protein
MQTLRAAQHNTVDVSLRDISRRGTKRSDGVSSDPMGYTTCLAIPSLISFLLIAPNGKCVQF